MRTHLCDGADLHFLLGLDNRHDGALELLDLRLVRVLLVDDNKLGLVLLQASNVGLEGLHRPVAAAAIDGDANSLSEARRQTNLLHNGENRIARQRGGGWRSRCTVEIRE